MPKIKQDFSKLKELGDERYQEIERMLLAGRSPAQVLDIIRLHWKISLEGNEASLKRMLGRLKKKLTQHDMAVQLVDAGALDKATNLIKKLNSVDELTKLVHIQAGRLEKALQREKDAPLLLEGTGLEITRQLQLLKELGRMQLETGILPRAPKVVEGTIQQDENDPSVIRLRVTEDTQKAMEFFETVPDEDGTYTVQ